jgi:hypothetical protein
MTIAKQVGSFSDGPDELAEIKRQMQLWHLEAVLLGRSVKDIAARLRVDASDVQFKGDLITFDGRSSGLASVIVDMARIRNVVCHLKALQAQRKQIPNAKPFSGQKLQDRCLSEVTARTIGAESSTSL